MMFFIKKNNAYYRENCKGYTYSKLEAGIYDKEFTERHAKQVEEVKIIPVVDALTIEEIENDIERLKKIRDCFNGKLPNNWISVNDKLPSKNGLFLVLVNQSGVLMPEIKLYQSGHWVVNHKRVAYWKPLPESPSTL